uniref:Uncharacterized protein n=1 Tax=Arion vulgaris TaxID=1028688 RepID=A0A0B7BMX1_9EUPU
MATSCKGYATIFIVFVGQESKVLDLCSISAVYSYSSIMGDDDPPHFIPFWVARSGFCVCMRDTWSSFA